MMKVQSGGCDVDDAEAALGDPGQHKHRDVLVRHVVAAQVEFESKV
jgi:hypothetical protein